MNNQATAPLAASAARLTIADLKPAEDVFASQDAMVLALCDNSFLTPDITSGDERFCHQLRQASNADTVYLCCRRRLSVTTTSAAANDVENEDTQAIHNALLKNVDNLDSCKQTAILPALQVFPDHAKMAVLIVPVSAQLLAVIVDPDDPYRDINQYCASAVAAIYHCHTAKDYEGFAPTLHQIQKFVLDDLNRAYKPVSESHTEYRLALFKDDLTALDVTFEKLIEPQPAGTPAQWGWEATPVHASTQINYQELRRTAALRPTEFTTALDLCVLRKTTAAYKTICESAGVQRFDELLPVCLPVALASLQQAEYIEELRQIIEKRVITGSHLVFEVRDSADHDAINGMDSLIRSLRRIKAEFDIRFLLSESVLKHASLTTLLALEPDFIKFNHFVSKAGVEPVGTLLSEFSVLAETGISTIADFSPTMPATGKAAKAEPSSRETASEAVPN